MSEGFLGRWSRRKLDVKEGKAVEAEPAAGEPVPPTAARPVAASRCPRRATLPSPPEGRCRPSRHLSRWKT